MGFLDLMTALVRLPNRMPEALTTSEKSPKSVMMGFVKLVRSLPEEKLPPSPMRTMNFTFYMVCAELIASVSVRYMSILNALYRLGRLNFIVILGPSIEIIMFWLF